MSAPNAEVLERARLSQFRAEAAKFLTPKVPDGATVHDPPGFLVDALAEQFEAVWQRGHSQGFEAAMALRESEAKP